MRLTIPAATEKAMQFEEKILPNGLALRLLPMPNYGAVHAIYATDFGSIHRSFSHGDDKKVELPAGVAHFLEHKMFENEDGVDAFSLYAETGASANAYTGFDRTSYIFTATDAIDQNLDILLYFVGRHHFSEATVQKEQGIIDQEILMYQDSAGNRCMFTLLEGLYHNHPVRDEIVGTVDSIAAITPELLYRCTDAFYTPANMALTAAGNITMSQLQHAVERAGLAGKKSDKVVTHFPAEPASVVTARQTLQMAVAMPVFGIGYKETPDANGNTLHTEVTCNMITELLCGQTSRLYHELYDQGLVRPNFGGEYGSYRGCLNFVFLGESPQPDKVRDLLQQEIERQRQDGVDTEQFETCKRMMYGEAIADLQNVEQVASRLSSTYFYGRTPQQELQAVTALTVDDVNAAMQRMLKEENRAVVVINPIEK